MPTSKFRVLWNFITFVTIVYLLVILPFIEAFLIEFLPQMAAINSAVDSVFIVDLFITLLSAYERKDGVLEVRLTRIIKHNFTFNIFTDIVSAFPFFTLAGVLNIKNSVAIVAIRLFKIIKMMRVLSKIKIVKYLKYSRLNLISRWFSDHNLRMT